MPPASLSTFAVMKPGPTTARNSRIRVFQRLKNLMGTFHRHGSNQRPDRINADRQFWIDRNQFLFEAREQKQKRTGGRRKGHDFSRADAILDLRASTPEVSFFLTIRACHEFTSAAKAVSGLRCHRPPQVKPLPRADHPAGRHPTMRAGEQASYNFSRNKLITSSDVITPVNLF